MTAQELMKHPKLEKFKAKTKYVVMCDSCGETFADLTVAEFLAASSKGLQHNKWYFKAAYHWVDHQSHEVNVHLILSSGERQTIYHLSQSWIKDLQYEPDQSREALIRELELMERTACQAG